ncbi:MAG: NAD(P)H-hydrate dehydratase [Clostridia bacterium]|nr:NAD(P)H-hydrate dehydratase [Clostridia bacterium]
MYTVSPSTIKYADSLAVEKYGIADITLMKNAAKSCFEYIYPKLSSNDRIAVICGKGNNGGDGYEIARILKKEWFDVIVINVFDCEPNTETSRTVYNACKAEGVSIVPFSQWEAVLGHATVIIDALFGVGFYGSISENDEIGRMLCFCNRQNALKIAIDTPSGINSADGRCNGISFTADFTVTMAYIKTGMLSYPAREYCGEILIADIGYPKELCEEVEKDAIVADDSYIKDNIPKRKSNTHKGSFGRLLMYCGSPEMTGAAVLSATAAIRSGAGLVNIARDRETIKILQTHLIEPIFSVLSGNPEAEVITLCEKASATLIGCGMGQAECDRNVLYSLIKNANCNLIIDADGINLLCENKLILKEAVKTPIITPHPMEFARLCRKSVSEVQSDRINLAKEFAKEYGCVVVLKGAGTVIASPDGRLAINTSGNPGLSKGGSGDVLAGLISSLVCQGVEAFKAAVISVYLHGKAADILKEKIGEYGLIPSDLPMEIAKLLP